MAPSLPRLCEEGKLEKVRAALKRGEEVNKRQRAEGYTGLILAALKGHEAVVELLLQQPGLDVNLTCHVYRRTALHMACRQGHAGIFRRLLAHPSLTCHNDLESEGFSPLMLAVEGVDLEIKDLEGVGLEEVARIRGYGLEAWQVVRVEMGRREEGNRILSIDEMMAKCSRILEKHSKKKK